MLTEARDAAVAAVARAEQAQRDGVRPHIQWLLNCDAREALAAFGAEIMAHKQAHGALL